MTFRIPLFLLLFPCLGMVACTKKEARVTEHDLNLSVGIRGVASLGDTERQMLQRGNGAPARLPLHEEPGLRALNFSHFFYFQELGARVYFRKGRAALIAAQEPFQGTILGTELKLFVFSAPQGKSWDEILTRKLGEPIARASGGRLGSEALFYNWGDVSYNRMGPNEIALYRDPDISRYRLKHFGRDLKLFPRH